jgi:hypothetical protein
LKDHLLPGKSGQLPRFLWPGNMVKQGNIKTSISIAKDSSDHGLFLGEPFEKLDAENGALVLRCSFF